MNKQEAIELLRDVAKRACYRTGRRSVHIDEIVELVNQIDEPQKVAVPKFVAEWLEEMKNNCLLDVILCSPIEVKRWLYGEENENEKTFIRAWLDIVSQIDEQEKLYTVEIPNPNIIGNEHTVLMKNIFKQIVIRSTYGDNWKTGIGYRLTESEIKQDFDFLWELAKPAEDK